MIRNGKTIICNQCGSNEIDFVSEDYGVCSYCRSKVFFNKEQFAFNDKDEKTRQAAETYADCVSLVVKPVFTEKQFLRRVLINIAKDKRTPQDIFTAKFKPVKKIFRHIVIVEAKVDISYNVTLGHDGRTSSWSNNRRYTRTVTEWEPASGLYSVKESEFFENSQNGELDAKEMERLKDALCQLTKDYVCFGDQADIEAPSPKKPSSEVVKRLVETIRQKAVQSCKNSLRADKIKYFKSDESVSNVSVKSLVVPEYIVEFVYKGITYAQRAFPIGNMKLAGSTVAENYNLQEVVKKKCKFIKFLTAFLVCFFIGLTIALKMTLLIVSAIFMFIAGLISYKIVYTVKCKQIPRDRQFCKLSELTKLLDQTSLHALSENEAREIME